MTPELWVVLGEGLKLLRGLIEQGAFASAKAVLDALLQGHAGTVSPQTVLSALQTFKDQLDANDRAALDALHARFNTP